MSGGIDKIVLRLETRIGEGQFYEAQQQARVVAARYIKGKKWDSAIDLLYQVSQALLKAKQCGSGGDLCIMMVDIFCQAKLVPDAANKAKVLTCLRLFDSEELSRKKFIGEILSWSSKFGEFPAGDPELHHVAGSLYAEERDAYNAERHLTLGTKESAEIFGRLEYEWYKQNGSPYEAAIYASRAIIPYILVANLRGANTVYQNFTISLSADNPTLAVEHVEAGTFSVPIFSSLPLLNFLGLLLAVLQTGNAGAYRGLLTKYQGFIKDVSGAWQEPLDIIGEMYFKIQRPKQSNPLIDMMGSLLGGGGAPAPKNNIVSVTNMVEAPAAESLD